MNQKPRELPDGYLKSGQYYGQVLNKRDCAGALLAEISHSAGRKLPAHSHERAFFCLLVTGGYQERFCGKTYEYRPLTVVFHRPDLTHRDEIGEGGGRLFSIEIQDQLLERLREYSRIPDIALSRSGDQLSRLSLHLYREHVAPSPASPLIVEGLLMEMLGIVARDAIEKQPPPWLGRVVEILHSGFADSLTTTEIAAQVGVHPFHLSRVFRRFYRQSLGEYANRLRVEAACRRMSEPEARLADIAIGVGFADQSHFNRIFKQITGMTPGAFRANTIGRS